MPLQTHTAHSPAGLPVDETTRPELIDFGTKNLRSENVRQNQRGATEKRSGFAAMVLGRSDATTPTVGYKLFSDRRTIVRITDGPQADAYSPKYNAWVPMGSVPEVGYVLDGLPMVMSTATLAPEDVEFLNGYLFVQTRTSSSTSTDGSLIQLDPATMAPVRVTVGYAKVLLASYSTQLGQVSDPGGTQLSVIFSNVTTIPPTPAIPITFPADKVAGTAYATCGLSDRIAVAYVNSSGGTSRVTVKTCNAAGIIDSVTINTSSAQPDAVEVACYQGTGTLWVSWNEGNNVKMIGYSPTSLSTVVATTGTIVPVGGGAGVTLIGIAPGAATSGKIIVNSGTTVALAGAYNTSGGVASAVGSPGTIANAAHCGRPFFYNGRYYVLLFSGGTSTTLNTQQVLILVDWTDTGSVIPIFRPVANLAPGLAVTAQYGKMKVIAGATAGTFYSGFGITRSFAATGGNVVTFSFNDPSRWQPVTHGDSTYLSGGLLSYFDSLRVAEAGFLTRPSVNIVLLAATGITGTFRYVAVYEEVDADGNWHISGVSDPSIAVTAANQNITISASPLVVTSRTAANPAGGLKTNVRVAFYRTLTGGSPPYYRLVAVPNVTTANVAYTDTTADTTLNAAAKLYEQPSVPGTAQDRRPAPGFSAIVSYNGMLVGAVGSDLWYSGQSVSGEGVWFNPIFQTPIPGLGPITGLAVLDGALFVFKRRDVFAIAGDAPADNGSSGGLGAPRRIASDVGCIEPRSTCTTSLGVMFQSERGIEILSRAQTVEWLGEPYDVTIDANTVCTSITVEPIANVAIVELAASQAAGAVTGTGCALVYDLSLKSWVSKDTRLTSGVPAQSACIVYTGSAYAYAWLSAAGGVYTETQGASLDAGAWVPSLIETGNARHGLQQEQRIWSGMLLFQRVAAAGLKVEVGYDYSAYQAADDKVWTEAETTGQKQLEWRPKPRGQAMRFRISDSAPAVLGTGQGLTFIGLSLNLAPKQGSTTGTPRLDPSLRK